MIHNKNAIYYSLSKLSIIRYSFNVEKMGYWKNSVGHDSSYPWSSRNNDGT
jgi:hypothetical protein